MIKGFNPGLCISFIVLLLISGCAKTPVNTEQFRSENNMAQTAPEAPRPAEVSHPPVRVAKARHFRKVRGKLVRRKKLSRKKLSRKKSSNKKLARKKPASVVRRVVTVKELRNLEQKDPDLDFHSCLKILSRLNKKDREYILRDIKLRRRLIAPRDFSLYKHWSPLPKYIPSAGRFRKFILIVKNISFLGWYQYGRRVDDTYVCTGKMAAWTKTGFYKVNEKDPNHMSTYPDAYGEPAFMPNALHIYARVWIHTGDVIGPNCSHGCINVPISPAENLYKWTNVGAGVLITDSLKHIARDMKAAGKGARSQKRVAGSGARRAGS